MCWLCVASCFTKLMCPQGMVAGIGGWDTVMSGTRKAWEGCSVGSTEGTGRLKGDCTWYSVVV